MLVYFPVQVPNCEAFFAVPDVIRTSIRHPKQWQVPECGRPNLAQLSIYPATTAKEAHVTEQIAEADAILRGWHKHWALQDWS